MSDFVAEHPVGDDAEEIYYFRSIHPKFKSLLVYYTEHHLFFSTVPELGIKAKKRYFLVRLGFIADFFEQHRLHYDYYRLDGGMLDEVFYTRKDQGNVFQPVVSGYDPFFGPAMPELVSWFIAFERLRNEILGALHAVSGKMAVSHTVADASGGL